MIFSLQSFPETVENFLTKTLEDDDQSRRASCSVTRPHNGSNIAMSFVNAFNQLRVCRDTFFLFRI
jgi:hypothetical protein